MMKKLRYLSTNKKPTEEYYSAVGVSDDLSA